TSTTELLPSASPQRTYLTASRLAAPCRPGGQGGCHAHRPSLRRGRQDLDARSATCHRAGGTPSVPGLTPSHRP
ncbi:hypothetical protein, partial [uncultured Actinomyces sp.]|uniref:hypothetical protein n=1 Tax=uncultured Actinomyces sp. TaxID=249061 RepID=UPI00280414E8